jgi:hypothetical protein
MKCSKGKFNARQTLQRRRGLKFPKQFLVLLLLISILNHSGAKAAGMTSFSSLLLKTEGDRILQKKTSTTTCLVDNCVRCADSTTITCSKCDTWWYRKTMSGGDKSYDVCWSIWKLLLAILATVCLCFCIALACTHLYHRGRDGKPCCGGNNT